MQLVSEGFDVQRDAWSMRDIMLIRWFQTLGFWERVYIAYVAKDAWESAEPEFTRVLLG